jgi:hypothetical protein
VWARCGYWWVGKTVRRRRVKKNNSFLVETLSKLGFFEPSIVLPPYPLLKTYDGWVRREGYSGPDLGEKSFQLFSLLIESGGGEIIWGRARTAGRVHLPCQPLPGTPSMDVGGEIRRGQGVTPHVFIYP